MLQRASHQTKNALPVTIRQLPFAALQSLSRDAETPQINMFSTSLEENFMYCQISDI